MIIQQKNKESPFTGFACAVQLHGRRRCDLTGMRDVGFLQIACPVSKNPLSGPPSLLKDHLPWAVRVRRTSCLRWHAAAERRRRSKIQTVATGFIHRGFAGNYCPLHGKADVKLAPCIAGTVVQQMVACQHIAA